MTDGTMTEGWIREDRSDYEDMFILIRGNNDDAYPVAIKEDGMWWASLNKWEVTKYGPYGTLEEAQAIAVLLSLD